MSENDSVPRPWATTPKGQPSPLVVSDYGLRRNAY